MQFNLPAEKKYLLVPAMPTPNGRMHLGHISGPYLKMDIIRRKVQRGDGEAYVYSGSDVYESYVELKATQLGITPKEVCDTYHNLIVNDLEALNISFNAYINPLDAAWNAAFISRQQELMQLLTDAGAVVEREEIFYYDAENDCFLNGCHIGGVCPNCNSSTGSYLCEICGTHYRPQDIFTYENYPGATKLKGKALYLKLDAEAILERMDDMGTGQYKHILKKYIELQGPYIRLTTPQRIGIEWELPGQERQVIFTFTALWFFSVFCADIYKELCADNVHPFDSNSDMVTIASFGVDSIIPYTAGVLAAGMSMPGFKPFDYFSCNYFYHLNGEKFSTSRLHVIWAADIVNIANVQPDAVRYYLTKQNPEFQVTNFDVNDFMDSVNNDLCGRWNQAITSALTRIAEAEAYQPGQFLLTKLERLVISQNTMLDPGKFQFSATLQAIEEWIAIYENMASIEKSRGCYWWLKGFAFLIYPIVPEMAMQLWKCLTIAPELNARSFFADNSTASIPSIVLFKRVKASDMEKCIPEKLKEKLFTNIQEVSYDYGN